MRQRAWVVLIATVMGVAVTANMGFWQLRRATQKISMQTAMESRSLLEELRGSDLARTSEQAESQHYRRVLLRGRWVTDRTVFLENRQMNGRVGFYVITPLQLTDRPEVVLVQRGWVPRDQQDRARLPQVSTPRTEIELVGINAPPPARLYEFSGVTGGAIRQNLDIGSFAIESGLSLLPLSVKQTDAISSITAGDTLVRQWPRPAVDVQKHYGYAFQWFALCALMAGLYVWFQIFRPRLRRSV